MQDFESENENEDEEEIEGPDEEEEQDEGRRAAPLAIATSGEPIDLPPEATGWRVRRHKLGASGGAPELVFDGGRPLILGLEATADDLIDRVGGKPGRYRLDAIDERGRALRIPPAYAVIEKGQAPGEGAGERDAVMARLFALVETFGAKLAEGHAVTVQQHAGMMREASGMLVPTHKRIEITPPVIESGAVVEKGGGTGIDWSVVLQMVAPSLPQLFNAVMERLSAPAAAARELTP